MLTSRRPLKRPANASSTEASDFEGQHQSKGTAVTK